MAKLCEYVHGSEHAVVSTPEVAEVVMSRVLTSEHSTGRSHLVLDERVPHAGADRRSPRTGDGFFHDVGRDEVVNNKDFFIWCRCLGAGNLSQGHNRRHCRRSDRCTFLVDDEAAVRVTVECETKVSSVLNNSLLQVHQVLGLEWVCFVVREVAIQFEIHRNDLDGQSRKPCCCSENRRHGHATHTVTRINNNPDGLDARKINQRAQVTGVVSQNIHLAVRTGGGHCFEAVLEVVTSAVTNGSEAGVQADSLSTSSRELDAVIGSGVVACREHRSRCIPRTRSEVGLVG